jgi:signal transduction histidine kinase
MDTTEPPPPTVLAQETVDAIDAATRAIAEVLDLETVLLLIVERVRDLVEARYAALGIPGPTGKLTRFITVGIDDADRARIGPLPVGRGLLGVIIREGRSLRIPDISAHPDAHGFPPHHPPMRSLLGVPITVGGRVVGDLYLTDKRGSEAFTAVDQRIVELFARHAGIAIENARLHERLAALRVVEERERIGRDLHDGVIQGLYAVSLSLEDVERLIDAQPREAADRVDRAIDAIHRSIVELRRFIVGLRPDLDDGDLATGIAALADDLRLTTALHVDVVIDPAADAPGALDPRVRLELLQFIREALSNVARHARASRVEMSLALVEGGFRLTVADDGIGFDPDAAHAIGHHGLVNLRARAEAAGARLQIDTRPGAGTRLIVATAAPMEAASP